MKFTIMTDDKRMTVVGDADKINRLFFSTIEKISKWETSQDEICEEDMDEDTGESNQDYQDWLASQKENKSQTVRAKFSTDIVLLADTAIATNPPIIKEGKTYRGFLYIKCKHCGKSKGFSSKENISDYICNECAGWTPLVDLKEMTADCDCGNKWKYQTNTDEPLFDINCINCGAPIPIMYHEKHDSYETVKGEEDGR